MNLGNVFFHIRVQNRVHIQHQPFAFHRNGQIGSIRKSAHIRFRPPGGRQFLFFLNGRWRGLLQSRGGWGFPFGGPSHFHSNAFRRTVSQSADFGNQCLFLPPHIFQPFSAVQNHHIVNVVNLVRADQTSPANREEIIPQQLHQFLKGDPRFANAAPFHMDVRIIPIHQDIMNLTDFQFGLGSPCHNRYGSRFLHIRCLPCAFCLLCHILRDTATFFQHPFGANQQCSVSLFLQLF